MCPPCTQLLSGSSILKDGRSCLDTYGMNLNTVEEDDIIGVMRTEQVICRSVDINYFKIG